MKKHFRAADLLPAYLIVFIGCILFAAYSSRAITAMAESTPLEGRTCIIIDAGHGGEDGGAVSCTGVYESTINLQIAQRLNALLRFLGYRTQMVRTENVSMHTQGSTIAAHKVSDLKNRVAIVNAAENALLLSIHQNSFQESKYYGAQVFYKETPVSKALAQTLQAAFAKSLDPTSNRSAKKAAGIYLMENIQCDGILIECGFLSNAEEEARLRTDAYQKKLCSVIACTISSSIPSQA